jgi:hypothetical protein
MHKGWVAAFIGGCAGLARAWQVGVFSIVRPSFVTWALEGDYLAPLMGWAFYRKAPLSFPIGSIPTLFPPEGTSVGLTDSVPLMAILFRPFASLLSEHFQYLGLWALGCFVMQGVAGALLGRRLFGGDAVAGGLVGAFFALSPPLASRLGHLGLLGHFVVVGAVGLSALPATTITARARVCWALALAVLAAAIHPYLVAMTAAVALAAPVREGIEGRLRWPSVGLWVAAVPAGVAMTSWLLGYFTGPTDLLPAEGFGQFSADVLALFNSWGLSNFGLPHLGGQPRQHEGFAYLGAGGLVLMLAIGARLFWRRPRWLTIRALLPVVLMTGILAFYALSSTVTVSGQPRVDLSWLYAPFPGLTGAFRTSGRFFWALHALVGWVGFAALRAFLPRPWLLRSLLLGVVVLLAADYRAARIDVSRAVAEDAVQLPDPAWQDVGARYKHLELYPLHLQWVCRFDPGLVIRFGLLAAKQGLTFNSGLVGRVSAATQKRCEAHQTTFDAQTVYIATDAAYVADVMQAGFACGLVDGVGACVHPNRPSALLDAVRRTPVVLP